MRVPVPDVLLPAEDLGAVHFVGIGGAGLSAIARLMLARGVRVSGSDARETPGLAALRELGATTWVGHDAAYVADADTLVVSTAVREDNPEVLEAQRRGLRVLPRSAALESVMQGRRVVAVAGTHGKTTTTSLLTVALQAAGADPTYAVGGELSATGVNAQEGTGEVFVAEADESDGAFLVYSPQVAVVTNVEADHLDNYGTEEAYHAAFETFLERVRPGGVLVACVDDPGAAALAATARDRGLRVVGVGESAEADLRASDLRLVGSTARASVRLPGGEDVELALQIPGRHYVLDALCALGAGLELGYDAPALLEGMAGFTGTRRRMELRGDVGGVRVYDSYAHHPQEIRGDLQAARSLAGEGRVLVVFQPHLVSRTRAFGPAMGQALGAADLVWVLEIYLAREDPDPEVTGALVAGAVPLAEDAVTFVPLAADVPAAMVAAARRGDVLLTLGAGDVTELAPRLVTALEEAGR
ncbi:UDP-N-acetylmuramate--L-alanine ligase [Marmoricola endophyticus]|uniref:UDP-N-acetylmuramate--L-alanine ligase n=1 Tax=Marmoricola endophyticus TaxID=2040280 RepID=A0A917BDP4_9ACTN|nr:UDP-N-acetylmuramate--L-alanine ligase [Marmoricola endophyticus]GGF37936.1 UDP-N-acetylmuramate--L-alanine ligase [Marmoricola endophyticus]